MKVKVLTGKVSRGKVSRGQASISARQKKRIGIAVSASVSAVRPFQV